jgi:hypothetical protein
MRLAAGTSLGPYEISGAIGAGGMGEVYRARDSRLGREVALKVLPREVAGDKERLARFEREARSASALNHRNIVTVHDFAFAGEDCYLVMELIRGESLRELVARGPVPLRKLYAIAAGIAAGLAAAHAAGIVHRDLKPENVMLTAEGLPKILDFGLVKSPASSMGDATTQARVTGSGVILGTLPYMSPEQAQGQTVGIASDQFAVGLMLYEMATGRHPFLRQTAYETVTAIIREEAPSLSASFPEPFRWIVERCLAKEPAQRYASTSDLAHDLRALGSRTTSGTADTVSSAPVVAQSATRWKRFAVAATAAATAAAITFVLLSLRKTDRIGDPLHLHLATGELQVEFEEAATPIAISPDGRNLITQGTNRNGSRELWLTDLRAGGMRLIVENAYGASLVERQHIHRVPGRGEAEDAERFRRPGTHRLRCPAGEYASVAWRHDSVRPLFGHTRSERPLSRRGNRRSAAESSALDDHRKRAPIAVVAAVSPGWETIPVRGARLKG